MSKAREIPEPKSTNQRSEIRSAESIPPAEARGMPVLQFAFGWSHSGGGGPGAKPHCTRGISEISSSPPLFIARRLLTNTSG
jgi:hypothetical protein